MPKIITAAPKRNNQWPLPPKTWQPHFLRLLISALFLVLITDFNSFTEQDQLAKAAQIINLSENVPLSDFWKSPDYYRKDLFSFYYITATALYKLTSTSPVVALNLLSLLCGSLSLTLIPAFFHRLFRFNQWATWLVILLCPAYIAVFSYGNETALAITCSAAAAFCFTIPHRSAPFLAAGFYVLAAFSRSDYIFVGPALALLSLYGAPFCKIRVAKRLACFGGAAFITGSIYALFFIRKVPAMTLFNYETNPALFAAFLVYGVGPTNLIFAAVGAIVSLYRRQWSLLFILPLLLQTLPYLNRLTSPKYILPGLLVILVFSIVGLIASFKKAPWLALGLIAFFALFSTTPYGLHGGTKAGLWYLPSDSGPLPTGGIFDFYRRNKSGFYQKRYVQDQKQLERALSNPPKTSNPEEIPNIAGWLPPQIMSLWLVKHHRYELAATYWPFFDRDNLGPDSALVLKTSYLYSYKHHPKLANELNVAYSQGRLIAPKDLADPFPDFIQIGPGIPAHTESLLGKRILFAQDYWKGEHTILQETFIKEYSTLSWISHTRYLSEEKNLPKPIYLDEEWAAFNQDIPKAIYYSHRFPSVYSKQRSNQNRLDHSKPH